MDKIIRAMTTDGAVKISAVDGRDLVARAKEIHRTTPTATAALGRLLCAASLLGNLMKEENASLTMRLNGGGPIGGIVAVSDSAGNVRGYVGDPTVDLPLRPDGKLDVGGAVGRDGMLTVSRDIGLKEPYIGSTEIVSGEIAEDVAAYMTESEQIPAAVGLGVLVETDLSVAQAGGFIVQLSDGGAEALIRNVLKGLEYETVETCPVEYRCNCGRERVEQVLGTIDNAELRDIIAAGEDISVTCQFCDAVYSFTPGDVAHILERKETGAGAGQKNGKRGN